MTDTSAFLRVRRRPRATPAPVAPSPVASAAAHVPAPVAPPTAPDRRRASRRPAPTLLTQVPVLEPGSFRQLGPADPVVQLDRVQAATGSLAVEVHAPDAVRAAVFVETSDGDARTHAVVVGPLPGHAPSASRPVVTLNGTSVAVDLGAGPALRRFALALTGARDEGVVAISTFDGARVEIPVRATGGGETAVVLLGTRTRSGLVLRAQGRRVDDGLRGVARAHGFDRISWQDPATPVAG
ncbi:hypothetical protein SAMN04489860_0644 [Paraoerskovia marina]|uniref:Uncharacterized protein n=1 Tax=Paraoerskovia marina TaxID=545619 RepID=A0A1H1NWY7_9CELL|nr:hypothetical protein [Paraoerskovia marina]SDS03486.1 hypothetical protein SAMN04489860_0644 [Paraoerskovia marina]